MVRTADGLRVPALVLLVTALAACDGPAPTETERHPAAGDFGPDVALDWFRLAYQLTQQERLSPPVASRAFGYLGVTLYESLVPGSGEYQSLAGQLNGLGVAPAAGNGQHYWPAVANGALAAIMRRMYGSAASQATIGNLEATLQARFPVAPGIVVAASKHGQKVAAFIYDWSLSDGFSEYHRCRYTPPVGPGLWRPTPPGSLDAVEPCWGRIRPFVLPYAGSCDAGPPPQYSADASSPFFREAKEVYETVANLTSEQLAIAAFWSDDPGATGTPPGHSVMIAAQVIEQQALPLDVAAETFAKVGIAAADAFIACWWTKFEHNLLRPITYVRDVFADPDWTTPLVTPPFPEYTSGHSVQSGATAQVLTDLFGDLALTDDTHVGRGLPARSFDSFFDAAEEAALSRLYGGIHFRSAIERGLDQGSCVGSAVSALRFRRPAGSRKSIHQLTADSESAAGELRDLGRSRAVIRRHDSGRHTAVPRRAHPRRSAAAAASGAQSRER